jgi:hypothetical protein
MIVPLGDHFGKRTAPSSQRSCFANPNFSQEKRAFVAIT